MPLAALHTLRPPLSSGDRTNSSTATLESETPDFHSLIDAQSLTSSDKLKTSTDTSGEGRSSQQKKGQDSTDAPTEVETTPSSPAAAPTRSTISTSLVNSYRWSGTLTQPGDPGSGSQGNTNHDSSGSTDIPAEPSPSALLSTSLNRWSSAPMATGGSIGDQQRKTNQDSGGVSTEVQTKPSSLPALSTSLDRWSSAAPKSGDVVSGQLFQTNQASADKQTTASPFPVLSSDPSANEDSRTNPVPVVQAETLPSSAMASPQEAPAVFQPSDLVLSFRSIQNQNAAGTFANLQQTPSEKRATPQPQGRPNQKSYDSLSGAKTAPSPLSTVSATKAAGSSSDVSSMRWSSALAQAMDAVQIPSQDPTGPRSSAPGPSVDEARIKPQVPLTLGSDRNADSQISVPAGTADSQPDAVADGPTLAQAQPASANAIPSQPEKRLQKPAVTDGKTISQDEPGPQTSASSYGLDAQPVPATQPLASLVLESASNPDASGTGTPAAAQIDSKARVAATPSMSVTSRPTARESANKVGDVFSQDNLAQDETTASTGVPSIGIPASDDSAPRNAAQGSNAAQWNLETIDSRVETSNAAADAGAIAFEAKLSPIAMEPDKPNNEDPQHSQNTASFTARSSAGANPGDAEAPPARDIPAPKIETLFRADLSPAPAAAPAAPHVQPRLSVETPANVSPTTRMEPLIESPAMPASSSHSITVKLPDANGESAIDLRFVDRGGDIHVSVRTADADVAHELRGGLNDLAARLEHAGLRAEVSSPSPGASTSQRDAQEGSPDRRGSGRNQADPDSRKEDSRDSSQARWVEAFENSAGSTNQSITFSQEQTT